ncbi:C1-like protein [Corchorus olitorius]|uniref:C1-like protein n=1 Tax=Corchorus olitorius TaxID=93759 RepID=A0A1R3GAT8_9ROSI|nr:C1-like protein [Corchorus olitorius]
MIFIENHNNEVRDDCRGCRKLLSGPIYKCLDCYMFFFHKKCSELPLQINNPYDRAHPLSLILRNPTAHQQNCSCSLCKIKWNGIVYCCLFCNIELTPEDVSAPSTIIAAGDETPWTLVSCRISFICDFCGDDGDRTPYISAAGDLILHKDCISMPKAIRIARYPHPICHVYSVQQNQVEDQLDCRICHENVNVRYGCYCCCASDCNYIAHVNCATDKDIWDGTVLLEDDIEMWKAGLGNESMNMITDVISEVRVGEDVMAREIKHAFHDHNLILAFAGEIEDDYICICDGCGLLIEDDYIYNYQQCNFVLHKSCAELPREKGVPAHKHVLRLTNNDQLFWCDACSMYRHGFSYMCDQGVRNDIFFGKRDNDFEIDVQCSLLPDTLRHPSHQHPLFFSHNFHGLCSGGCSTEWKRLAYRCTKRCEFAIDFDCLVLPHKAWYKYDKHLLTLTYNDNSDPNQVYCDFCEEERDPKPWFYHCSDCDNSLHKECALGQIPFIKLIGSRYHTYMHQHTLTFVKNIWNCPLCIVCGKVCYRQTLECKESGCDFTVHWDCQWKL